jgi:hypothetical protein
VKKYRPVKHLLRIFYWCMLLGTIGLVFMMAFEMLDTYYESQRQQVEQKK